MMIRVMTAALSLSFVGCDLKRDTSNTPDSGLTCEISPRPDAGSATLSGPSAFEVQSAYQNSSSSNDGGYRQFEIALYSKTTTCPVSASESALPILAATLKAPLATGTMLGEYRVGAVLPSLSANVTLARQSQDGGMDLVIASAGSVTLEQVDSCALRGSLNVEFPESDGGVVSLSGAVSPVFCD